MTTWAEFRDTLRRSMLADLEEANFTDDQLLDCYKFSLDTLCSHTALPKSVSFSAEVVKSTGPTVYYDMAVDTAFTLPTDLYEPLDVSGRVWVTDTELKTRIADPIIRTPGISPGRNFATYGFWTWPEGILNLNKPTGNNGKILVEYFAFYPYPALDSSLLSHPRWADTALQYLTSAHALSGYGVQSATIDRFKDRNDSGNPEHNALRMQQQHFFNLYEREVARRPTQDRSNFFRSEGMSNAYR